MNNRMTTHDVHMRYTDAKGNTHVQEHRVWDSVRFVAARAEESKKLNQKEADPAKRNYRSEQITEAQYRAERVASGTARATA
jgi:hypothetical protein